MIARRPFLKILGAVAAMPFLGPRAGAAAGPFRIHMLLWRGETEVEQGFRAYLAEHQVPVDLVVRDCNRDLGRLPDFLDEIRRERPDLVYCWGTGITLGTVGRWDAPAEAQPIRDIPVVFALVSAPVATGIAPPEGQTPRANVTGAVHVPPIPVQIAAMQAYLPLRRIAVIFNPAEANSVSNVAELRAAAGAAGVEVLQAPVPNGPDGQPDPASIPRLVAELAGQSPQLLYIGPDNFVGNHRDELTAAGIAHGLPCFTATELEVRSGDAMFGLVSRYDMVGRLAALKAKQVLVDGLAPSALPIETLDRFSFVIRLPVALRLGLYPPLPILDYAEIIR